MSFLLGFCNEKLMIDRHLNLNLHPERDRNMDTSILHPRREISDKRDKIMT